MKYKYKLVENEESMIIYDIKLDRSEDFIIGSYTGKFNPEILAKSIEKNYPSVDKYTLGAFEDSDGQNEGHFHVDILSYKYENPLTEEYLQKSNEFLEELRAYNRWGQELLNKRKRDGFKK